MIDEAALPRIRIYDRIFAHAWCIGNVFRVTPRAFRWGRRDNGLPVALYTDFTLHDISAHHQVNCAWMVESPVVFPQTRDTLIAMESQFDYVFTFDKGLLARDSKRYCFATLGGTWVRYPCVHPKSETVCLMVSEKHTSEGQRLRRDAMRLFAPEHVYGRSVRPFEWKEEALAPYRYAVVAENGRADYYFTEKLIDAFLTGTVPLYWGCPSIGDFFNMDGILTWETLDELEEKMRGLSAEDYDRRRFAMLDNFARAIEYAVVENKLWRNHLRPIWEGICQKN